MAIAGAPRIITQTASNLRVSNETESGFVQQGNTGLANSVFDGEEIFVLEDRIVVRRVNNDGSTSLLLYDFDLTLLSTYNVPNLVTMTFTYVPVDRLFIGSAKVGITGTIGVALSTDRNTLVGGAGYNPNGLVPGVVENQVLRAASSPDNSAILMAYTSQLRLYSRTSPAGYSNGTITNGAPVIAGAKIIKWSRNSEFAFVGLGSNMHVFRKDGVNLVFVGTVNAPGNRTIHNIAPSSDNVFLAISTVEDDEGLTVYNTYLYKRGGERFLPVGSITGFGAATCWNEIGDQLYDAGNRRAFKRTPSTNNFVELAGFMSNLPAGVLAAATSLHIDFPVGMAQFFDGVLYDVVRGAQTLEGWHVALLDENYVFNSSEIDAAAILTENEVAGAHWPEGGKELTNVQFQPYGNQGVFIDADDVSQIIYEGEISARYGLVYHQPTMLPLIFIDFQREVIAELNSKFTIKMGDFGFILISP